MHVRLKSLAVRVKSPAPTSVPEKAKTFERIPEVELNTRMAGISGLKGCKVGDKYRLVFDGEVKELRSPHEWELSNGYKPEDLILTFKLNRGGIEHEPKSIHEATNRAKDEKY